MNHWESFRCLLADTFHLISKGCSYIESCIRPKKGNKVTEKIKNAKRSNETDTRINVSACPFNLSILRKLFQDYEIDINLSYAFNLLLKRIERISFQQFIDQINRIESPDELYRFLRNLQKPDWHLPLTSPDASGPYLSLEKIDEYFSMEGIPLPDIPANQKVEFIINRSYAKAYESIDEQLGQLFKQFEEFYNNPTEVEKIYAEIKTVANLLTVSK